MGAQAAGIAMSQPQSAQAPPRALEIVGLTKSFDRRPAVAGLDLTVRAGEVPRCLAPTAQARPQP